MESGKWKRKKEKTLKLSFRGNCDWDISLCEEIGIGKRETE